jgi:hypothetical protein
MNAVKNTFVLIFIILFLVTSSGCSVKNSVQNRIYENVTIYDTNENLTLQADDICPTQAGFTPLNILRGTIAITLFVAYMGSLAVPFDVSPLLDTISFFTLGNHKDANHEKCKKPDQIYDNSKQ